MDPESPSPNGSKPLTADELTLLEAKAGVTGLSTIDVRRLLANYRRLRELVVEAGRVLENSQPVEGEAREVHTKIKHEVER